MCAPKCAQLVPRTSSMLTIQIPHVVAFNVKGDGLNGVALTAFAVEHFRVSVFVTYTCRCAVRWPSGRRRRFAKRKSASRVSSIFLVNPSLHFTSSIRRFGWRWLWRRCFGASQGQSWGQFTAELLKVGLQVWKSGRFCGHQRVHRLPRGNAIYPDVKQLDPTV